MNQLAISIILSCFGVAMTYSSGPPFSYSEILPQASQPRDKRQSIYMDTNTILECVGSTAEAQCTSGFNEGFVNTLAQCGRNDLASEAAKRCARNEKGELCAAKIVTSLNSFNNVRQGCQAAIGLSPCTSGCTTALQTLRNDLGCCINSIFNVSGFNINLRELPLSEAFSQVGFNQYFSSHLMAVCGVETIEDCPSIPSFTPGIRDIPCTYEEALQHAIDYQCGQTNVQFALNILSKNNNCQNFTATLVNNCGQTSNGNFCSIYAMTNRIAYSNLFSSVFHSCSASFEITQTCPSNCRTAIEQLQDNAGCCLNNLENVTATGGGDSIVTRYELWKTCNVSSPGFCNSTLMAGSDSASSEKLKAFSMIVIALTAITILLIAN